MLSKAKIASEAELSTSIVKYYMENYKEFFVSRTVEGSPHPVYDEQAITIVKRIRELTQQNKNREQIKDSLKEEGYSPVIDMVETTTYGRQPADHNSPSIVGQPLEITSNLRAAQSAISALTQLTTDYEELVMKQERFLAQRKKTIQENEQQIAQADAKISKLKEQLKVRDKAIKQLYNRLLQTDLGKDLLERLTDKPTV